MKYKIKHNRILTPINNALFEEKHNITGNKIIGINFKIDISEVR